MERKMIKNIALTIIVYFATFTAFAKESFLTYCLDCKRGDNFANCTPEIKQTVDALKELVDRNYCHEAGIALENLRTLSLKRKSISDLSPLSKLTGIVNLNLSNNRISDLEPLSGFVKLRHLNLSKNRIFGLRPLKALKHLEILDLSENNISNFRYISNLGGLEKLNLSKNMVSDLESLNELKGYGWLTKLNLSKNQISDLEPISDFLSLKKLDLSDNQISYIEPLSTLTNLEVLDLSENSISNISFLSQLELLTKLNLSNNMVSNLRPLAELKKLTIASLKANHISEIRPLTKLKNLYILFLEDNQIKDINPLSQLKNMKLLYLKRNQIEDLSPLSALKNIRILNLRGNKVSDLEPISNLVSLKELTLWENNITDFTPINHLKGKADRGPNGHNIWQMDKDYIKQTFATYDEKFNIYNLKLNPRDKFLEHEENLKDFLTLATEIFEALVLYPHLIKELKLKSLSSLLKQSFFMLYSPKNSNFSKLIEKFIRNNTSHLINLLDAQAQKASDDLSSFFRDPIQDRFLEGLKTENDIHLIQTFIKEIGEANSSLDEAINKTLEVQSQLSIFRSYVYFKYFLEKNPLEISFIESLVSEKNSISNSLLDQDFNLYGRWGAIGYYLENRLKAYSLKKKKFMTPILVGVEKAVWMEIIRLIEDGNSIESTFNEILQKPLLNKKHMINYIVHSNPYSFLE